MFLSTSKGWGASGSGREVEFVWDIYNCVPEEIILIRVLKFEDAQTSKVLCAGTTGRTRAGRRRRLQSSYTCFQTKTRELPLQPSIVRLRTSPSCLRPRIQRRNG